MNPLKRKIFKLITRAMEDTRGLDDKYQNEEDAQILADTLNSIAMFSTDKIYELIKK